MAPFTESWARPPGLDWACATPPCPQHPELLREPLPATYSIFHSINILAHLLAGTRLCTNVSKCKGSECLFSKADSALTWELISLPQFFFVIPPTLQGCHAVEREYGESVQHGSEYVPKRLCPPRMHTVQQREGTEGRTAHSRHSGDFI